MLQIMEAYAEYSSITASVAYGNYTEINKDINLNYFHTNDLLFYKLCLKTMFRK